MSKVDEKARGAKITALKRAMAGLDRSLKKKNVLRHLSDENQEPVDCIPTGILQLDVACTGRGIKRSTIVELFGPESSGKSLISMRVAAAVQAIGGTVAYIDNEFSFDPVFAAKLGVRVNDESFVISQPDTLEETMDIIDALVDAGVDLIICDSVASLVPKDELEGGVTDAHIGLTARALSQSLRRFLAKLARTKSTIIFVNQIRDKIGITYGDSTSTPGGRALKFYASIRMRVGLGAGGKIFNKASGDGREAIGQNIKVTVVKNKTAAPYKTAEFQVFFDGRKVDEVEEVAALALAKGMFTRVNKDGEPVKTGLFFTWPSVPEFHVRGKDGVAQALRDHPQVLAEIKEVISKGTYEANAPRYDGADDEEDEEDLGDDFAALDLDGAEGDDGEE